MKISRWHLVVFAFIALLNTGLFKARTLSSCSVYKKRHPDSTDGYYIIDPDGRWRKKPFRAYCDMSDKNGVGVTIISHNSEERTLVNGCKGKGCFLRSVTYTGATLAQLVRLTDFSVHCEQFIKYECHSALLLHHGFSWLVSGRGCRFNYWGGASPGSNKCACGMTKSCASKSRFCNCDKNDNKWREDSGLLTYNPDLPVSQLRFGGVRGGNKKGYFTLGKLKCYGMKPCAKDLACQNGGICMRGVKWDYEVCNCAAGFTGEHCEIKL